MLRGTHGGDMMIPLCDNQLNDDVGLSNVLSHILHLALSPLQQPHPW